MPRGDGGVGKRSPVVNPATPLERVDGPLSRRLFAAGDWHTTMVLSSRGRSQSRLA